MNARRENVLLILAALLILFAPLLDPSMIVLGILAMLAAAVIFSLGMMRGQHP